MTQRPADVPNCKCAVQRCPPQTCTYPDCHEGKYDEAVRWANRVTPEQQAMIDAAPKYGPPVIGSIIAPCPCCGQQECLCAPDPREPTAAPSAAPSPAPAVEPAERRQDDAQFLRWCVDRAEGYRTGFGITGVPGCDHPTFASAVEAARPVYDAIAEQVKEQK